MEPETRFCTSPDGTQLAFTVYGDGNGTPAVQLTNWSANQDLFDAIPKLGRVYDLMGEARTFVTTDLRGVGGSQREITHISLDVLVVDLASIIDALGVETVDLIAFVDGTATAAAYAAQNRDRVKHLILVSPVAHGDDLGRPSEAQSVIDLINANWPLAQRAVTDLVWREAGGEFRDAVARNIKRTVSSEVAARYVKYTASIDVRDIFLQVTTPTLVMDSPGNGPISGRAKRAAALIPDAKLVKPERGLTVDNEAYVAYWNQFLDDGSAKAGASRADTHTILFTDMASSTSLTQQLGDAAAQDVRRAHNEVVRAALSANTGSEIKHTGDGIMASFSTASAALDAAIAIQRGVAAHKEANPDSPLAVYVGLNAGEPIAEDDDLFGTSINLAARICDHAEPGQILAADVVRQLAAGKDFLFSDLGETGLRGFEDPVKLWELRWQKD